MPTSGDAIPDPKARTLTRGSKRYRRKVASPKQWAKIAAEKLGPCRICGEQGNNGRLHGKIHLHHIVPRGAPWFGEDVPENIAPLCPFDHDLVTRRDKGACVVFVMCLADDEYAYAVERGGEAFWERAYGVEYRR